MKMTGLHIAVLICAVVAFAGCATLGPSQPSAEGGAASSPQPSAGNGTLTEQDASCSLANATDCVGDVRITLIKFHGNQQCTSCMNLGKFANATLQKQYAAELASGAIRYLDINADAEPDNELVLKYRPTHASLYMVVNQSGVESFEELTQAWYYTGDESAYSNYLSGVIDARLE